MLKRPSKILLWIGGSGLIVLGCGVGLLLPIVQKITAAVQTITSLQHDQTVVQTNLKNLITLKQHNPDLDKSLATLGQAFVSANNPLPFVTEVEDLANQDHVALQINIGQPDRSSKQPLLPVTTDFVITGQWSDCLAYIHALLTNPTYLVLKQITLVGSTDHLTVTIHGVTYWLQ